MSRKTTDTAQTTQTTQARAMTEAQIDRLFAGAQQQLEAFERVPVTLPHTGRPGEDVLELGYNGRMFLLRRGEPVMLPAPLADVLRDAGAL